MRPRRAWPPGVQGDRRSCGPAADRSSRRAAFTLGRDAKIDWKALSTRIGHADVAFTMKQYVQADLETDRQVATAIAELIMGGRLMSVEIPGAKDPGEVV